MRPVFSRFRHTVCITQLGWQRLPIATVRGHSQISISKQTLSGAASCDQEVRSRAVTRKWQWKIASGVRGDALERRVIEC